MNDPVAAYFEKHAETHKRQFVGSGSGASFYFQTRLKLACELAGASTGRLLDCAAGSGEITCALLESGRFPHATIVDISPAMLQSARELLSSQVTNVELEFVHSDIFNFKPYDELPMYYALANAFVHPSTTEQWGLVVNEAIASGLPVIVSERCGCVPELVQGNGFTFDPMDEHELASLLFRMATLSDDDRRRLGDASYGIAANFSPERFGEGLERAARMALELAPRRFGVVDRALLFVGARYGQ